MITAINITLLTFLLIVAIGITRTNNLFSATILAGIYSLVIACVFTFLDAVDVAFTEASVGAGVSTVLILSTLTLTSPTETKKHANRGLALVMTLITGAALIYGTADTPAFGDAKAPVHSHVSSHYIDQSPSEIGIPNMVTSVLASYRGYDTLGETAVIFTACMAVMLLLQQPYKGNSSGDLNIENTKLEDYVILRIISKLFIPVIILFALYVQFHGDFGPGGGFQAGVIFASAVILYGLVFGTIKARNIIPPRFLFLLVAGGLLLYAGTGIMATLTGGNFLQYRSLLADPLIGEHVGILTIELGVGITVATAMISIFFCFADRKKA
ncbi:MAG: DUF4040 domain-containing protein [Candidatus Latescibacterota bacterium]|nr:DUF4040 domain-containing protein [Candidatus Latescibacterota bacterium]